MTTGYVLVILSDYYDSSDACHARDATQGRASASMMIQEVERLLSEYAARETTLLAPDASIPLYYQLYRLLKRFIETAPLHEGDRFPSEDFISTSFGVSRPTSSTTRSHLASSLS